MNLSDFVYLDLSIARSVNLERDQCEFTTLQAYQLTAKSIEVLARFVSALHGEKISAWSLTGPYGMGKSAFANFLIALTGKESNAETSLAMQKLREVDNELYCDLKSGFASVTNGQGFIQVPVTAAYEPINHTMVRGLLRYLTSCNQLHSYNRDIQKMIDVLESISHQELPETQQLMNIITKLQYHTNTSIIFVMDEFGKNLEYMAHHPDKGDIYIMQMLAETKNVFLWVCLHQAFEEYASGLTTQQRVEWSKVHGRFEDISFVESSAQMLSFMRKVLKQKDHPYFSKAVHKWAEICMGRIQELTHTDLGEMNVETVAALYPIHPLAAIALPELCRRFAQNERTLFAFLCSRDLHALPSFLSKNNIRETDEFIPIMGLDHLYDYFFSVSTTAFLDKAESQRWIEIQDIIGKATSSSDISQRILKTVGILNLISSSNGLLATRPVLKFVLEDTLNIRSDALEAEIDAMEKRKTLIFREYANEYRLWEGSDFDIFKAIKEKKATLAIRPLDQVLQETFLLTPLIASRHSYKTGTVRKFECRWMSGYDLIQSTPSPAQGFDGLFVYCFGNEKREQKLPRLCSDGRPIIIAYAPHKNQIKELVLEAAAAKAVLMEAPELVRDGVARKEARYRVHAAEDQLRTYVGQVYSTGSDDLIWYSRGVQQSVRSHRDLSLLASQLCDEVFDKCPRIGNEMVNYNKLSGAAAGARRELAEAMVTRQREENLGMVGYGPEVAIYKSLFLLPSLHTRSVDGSWHFSAPSRNSDLFPLWQLLLEAVQNADSDGVRVDTLVEKLKEPPFGMREGTIPLYICLFLIVNLDEIALFQEGVYKPYFDEAEIALLLKRPELFTLKRFSPVGVKRDVFETYLDILYTANIDGGRGLRNPTLLSVVGPLVKFVEDLPKYSRFSRSVSTDAIRVRSAILNATDPLKLLFEELPHSVGIEPAEQSSVKPNDHWKKELQQRLKNSLLELMHAYDKLNRDVRKATMETFEQWTDLDRKCKMIEHCDA